MGGESQLSNFSFGRIFKFIFVGMFSGVLMVTGIFGVFYWQVYRDFPEIMSLDEYRPRVVSQVVTEEPEGEFVIGEFFKERRYVIPFEEIPEVVVRAFVAAEDDRFFEHEGISFAAILRAAMANFKAGHVVQGGSTITQQVAKSLFLSPEKIFVRKIKEAILAKRMEDKLTKEQILFLYLNQIYLGHGAYGVKSAAQVYFRKPVSDLSLAEASILAGLPQAPSKYSPYVNGKKSKDRQRYVLRRMKENKFITEEEEAAAFMEQIKIYDVKDLNSYYAAYLTEHVRRYLIENYGEKAVYEEGLKVKVPSTRKLFLAAKKALREGLREVDKRRGYRGPTQKIESNEEYEDFVIRSRRELVKNRLEYRILLPDGDLSFEEAMRHAEISKDGALLELGKIYQGVVTAVEDKEEFATVMIGSVEAKLPLEELQWTSQSKERRGPSPKVKKVSSVLTENDVVFVRTISLDPKKDNYVVSLEQNPIVQGALFSIDVRTGYVLAMEGGYRFTDSEFNRVVQAQRQPGSAFKPLIFSAGIEKGYHPASIIVDSPIVYSDDESGKWKPTNFEEKFYGDTPYRLAFIKSRNIPTIKLVQDIGVPRVIQYARRLGMEGKFNEDLSISLGSATTSLFELTQVFSIYPRLGRKSRPIAILEIQDRDGNVLEKNEPYPPRSASAPLPKYRPKETLVEVEGTDVIEPANAMAKVSKGEEEGSVRLPYYPLEEDPDQVMDPRVAFVMTHLMKEVVEFGTGRKAQKLERPSAGKTGTTNDYKDAWYIGFTPQIVTGTWVGFDDYTSLGWGETGSGAALPIWIDFMKTAEEGLPVEDFPVPEGIKFAKIDPQTGKLAHPSSASSIDEAFIEGTEPTERPASEGGEIVDSQTDFFKKEFE